MAKGRKTGGKDWKKGDPSPNPAGRPALPPEVRAFRKLTLAELQGYISEIQTMTALQIKRAARKKNQPALKTWIYSIAAQGIINGDERRFETLMDRVVGRVADQVNIKATIEKEIKEKTVAELVEEARTLIAAMEAAKK